MGVVVAAVSLFAATYEQEIAAWRQQREARLKADDGWLTLAGLFWLKDGENTAGSDPSSAIKLARGPAHIGVFEFHNGKTSFRPAAGVNIPPYPVLKTDTEAQSDIIR